MPKIKFLIAFSIILLTTIACSALSSSTPAPIPTTIIEVVSTPTAGNIPLSDADVPRVSAEEAKVAAENGAAIIVDVRNKTAYDAEHIAGSISIPLTDIEANPAGLQLYKNQWIITYCT